MSLLETFSSIGSGYGAMFLFGVPVKKSIAFGGVPMSLKFQNLFKQFQSVALVRCSQVFVHSSCKVLRSYADFFLFLLQVNATTFASNGETAGHNQSKQNKESKAQQKQSKQNKHKQT